MFYTTIKRRIKNQTLTDRLARAVVGAGQFVNREVKRRPNLSPGERYYAYKRGYFSESLPLFEIDRVNNSEQYLTNWRWLTRTPKINGRHGIIHDHKVHTYHVFYSAFPKQFPELFGYVDGEFRSTPFCDHAYYSLDDCLSSEPSVVSKPISGSGGSNVRIHDGTGNVSEKSLQGQLLQECVTQADYAADINSQSVNTLRLITMIDPDTREPFISAGVQRFGLGNSPVDNWSSGGIGSKIDIKTGEIGTAVGYPTGSKAPKYHAHPETGAQIKGVQIPAWQTVRDSVLEMAEYIGDLTPYIGWDVVVTSDSGEIMVIETNNNPDIDLIQPHIPLLADDRNRRFYEYHDVI